MTVLHLGVTEMPYSSPPDADAPKPQNGTQTTGDVAGWLEEKYGVMTAFFARREEFFAGQFENSVQGAIESLLMGGPSNIDPFGSATSGIETEFRKFLESGEIETMGIAGVPTQAAQDRRSQRFKKRRAPKPRPSFIDTGLYENSFRSWID